MELRFEVAAEGQRTRMVRLSCDVTATVGDLARALVRAGMPSDAALADIAATRAAPLALLGRAGPHAHRVLLDPAALIAESGLQSGWIIEAVREDAVSASVPRAVPSFGSVEICSGAHRGARYSLVAGANAIGRDRRSRIHLDASGVSRRHATIEVGDRVVLRDHGSANGSWIDGQPVTEVELTGVTEVEFGDATVRVELTGAPVPPVPPVSPEPTRPTVTHPHIRAPRVEPRFPRSERTLPAPPVPSSPGRLPLIGVIAPAVLGVAMYALTGSAMSLLMIAFSPLLMLGSWLDGRFGGTRAARREGARFRAALQAERDELRQFGLREVQLRAEESPSMTDIAEAIRARGPLLWARRPEHRGFLELRLGEGRLPSRTVVVPPERGQAPPEHWAAVRECATEFELVGPVPVLERFAHSGSIGVAGASEWAQGCARSIVMQLVGLHSPAELVLACVGAPASWHWLAWLPHVDPPTSPLTVWPLADDPASAARLIAALEGVLAVRRASEGAAGAARSHLSAAAVRAETDTGPAPPQLPAIIVLVCDTRDIDPARLIALAEHGPDVGIHLIWIAERATQIPAACRTLLEVERGAARVLFSRNSETVELSRFEFLDAATAEGLARSLAPVVDIGCPPRHRSDLPGMVALRDLHPVDLLGGSDAILAAWRASGSLTGEWSSGAERPAVSLDAVVGQSAAGPLSLDLREHGPHALVAGTTGSGKSELLQSWIMSLAARIGPDRLTFLLVDYKGGAAFAECARLPHAVGLLTDLDTHLVRRALASLRAEVRLREELLARHGAKDLIALERRSEATAPPVLVIVIDEFAALSREVPEFVPGIIDIAQRGRSLGLHLILATQRPAGVITEQLRANTNLRIALRMADAQDSTDVLGAVDAAHFDPAHPGRAAMRIGGGNPDHFQTGYLGGSPESARTPDLALHALGLSAPAEWNPPPEPLPPHPGPAAQPDIARVLESIAAASTAAACSPPRRPWLDPLPPVIALHALPAGDADPQCADAADACTIGLSDLPESQRQAGFAVDLERVGNLALVGASGTGKSSALLTCAAALSASAVARPVRIFAIDAAGGGLEALRSLPTVAAVAPLGEAELVDRVLRHLAATVVERGERFAEIRAGNLRAFQCAGGGGSEPRIVLLIDGFAALRATDDAPGAFGRRMSLLTEIMHAGRAVGVHVILTADRAGVLPPALAATVQQHLVFRLAGVADYAHYGIPSDMLAQAPAGRAVVAGAGTEVQLALPSERQEHGAQVAALEELAGSLRRAGVAESPQIENPPRSIPLCSLPAQFEGAPVIGVETHDLSMLTMPTRGLAVVAGPAGSGLTTAIRTLAAAHTRWCRAAGVQGEQILLSLSRRSPLGECRWDRTAFGAEEVVATACQVMTVLAEADDEPVSRPRLVVVEGAVEAEGAAVLSALSAVARAARRSQTLVVFEYELGHAAGVWELLGELRLARWGLSLQPDDADSGSPLALDVGRLRRGDLPPGRGFVVDGGRARPVQLASAWGSLED